MNAAPCTLCGGKLTYVVPKGASLPILVCTKCGAIGHAAVQPAKGILR